MLDCREVREFNCDQCYEITVEDCDAIIIDGGLTPDTTFFIHLYDQFDIKRSIEFTSGEDGSFAIDISLLPDNYFNPFGNYDFYISSDEEGLTKVPLTFNGEEFNCVILIID